MSTKNEQGYIWDEVLPDIIEELDWSGLNAEDWNTISDALNEHVSNSRDFMAPTPSGQEMFAINHAGEVGTLRARIEELERELDVHVKSVKARRGADEVYIEAGRVMYR